MNWQGDCAPRARLNSHRFDNSSALKVAVAACLVLLLQSIHGTVKAEPYSDAEAPSIAVVNPFNGSKVLPDYPLPPSTSSLVDLVAVRGEYESSSVVVRAGGLDLTSVTLEASELTEIESKYRILASNVDIRVVKPWFQGWTGWNDIGRSSPEDFRQVLVPELLLKNDALVVVDPDGQRNLVQVVRNGKSRYVQVNEQKLTRSDQALPTVEEFPVADSDVLQSFTIPKASSKQLFLTVHVPRDAEPGNYVGDVKIRSAEKVIGRVEISLKVLPFVLEQPSVLYSLYYRGQLGGQRATISSDYKTPLQMRRELQDMKEHGIGYPTLYQDYRDVARVRAALELRRDVGLDPGTVYYLGLQTTEHYLGAPVERAALNARHILPGLLRTLGSFGATAVYIYGQDEAKGEALLAQQKLWSEVHRAGGKVFAAGYTGAHGLVGDSLDMLVHFGKPDFREAALWHESGGEIFSYANPQTGPENPLLFRLNYGVVLWANNYDGAMDYAYQHCFGSCWNDIDHPKYRDHNLTYPTANGVISTLAWEGLREGVDDVRYINTLEFWIEKVKDRNPVRTDEAVDFLEELRANIRVRQSKSSRYNSDMKVDPDGVRREVIAHIGRLATP